MTKSCITQASITKCQIVLDDELILFRVTSFLTSAEKKRNKTKRALRKLKWNANMQLFCKREKSTGNLRLNAAKKTTSIKLLLYKHDSVAKRRAWFSHGEKSVPWLLRMRRRLQCVAVPEPVLPKFKEPFEWVVHLNRFEASAKWDDRSLPYWVHQRTQITDINHVREIPASFPWAFVSTDV